MIPFPLKPKVTGSARVTHRCYLCRSAIQGEPQFTYRNGQLVAAHAQCHQKETDTNGR